MYYINLSKKKFTLPHVHFEWEFLVKLLHFIIIINK